MMPKAARATSHNNTRRDTISEACSGLIGLFSDEQRTACYFLRDGLHGRLHHVGCVQWTRRPQRPTL